MTYDAGFLTPNGYCGVDPINLKALAKLVKATSAQLILSSDWRLKDKYDGQEPPHLIYLREQLAEYGLSLAGFTPDLGKRNQRAAEISESIKMRHIEDYLILDDEYFLDFSKFRRIGRFYRTDWRTGLTELDIKKILSNQCIIFGKN